MSDREYFDCTWAGVAAALRVPEHTARRLAGLAGLPPTKCRRMAPADRAALLAGIGLYRYSLHPGSRAERPCAYHADVAEFLGVHYATYIRWMRGSGLGAMLPRAAGATCCCLPNRLSLSKTCGL